MDFENNIINETEVVEEEVTTTPVEEVYDEETTDIEPVSAEVYDIEPKRSGSSAPLVLLGAAALGVGIAGGAWLVKKGKKLWADHKAKKAMKKAEAEKAAVDSESTPNEASTVSNDTVSEMEESEKN